jgi:PAB-dependent poly(A)-specific ribonuclease subunit 3
VFKAVNAKDGCVYAVRRVDNTRASGNLGAVQAMWARVSNANVLPLREAFVQNRALFLVHDFCPGAQTLKEFVAARGPGQLLPESALWAVATQLLSAVRAVHGAGLGSCVVGPSKVLLTGRYRARLSSAGLVHALEPAATAAAGLQEQQQEDILWVGKLVVMLATMNLGALANLALSVEHMKAVYSPELVAFALHAFKAQHEGRRCNVYDLLALASQALLAENDSLYAHGDALEETLARVYEADRLFRLMTKLSVVTERPPLPGQKPGDSWSETDDRYLIKLFRDYCFHQTDDADRPWLDLGHIVDCLNKLDVGSPERILLSSRDGRSFLVVSFDEIRLCVERSFQELLLSNPDHAAAMPPPPDP